jgi:hypothetical protein
MKYGFHQLFQHMDGFLIFFYRFSGLAFLDYLIGTFCLGFICVVIGELCISLALRFNRPYLDSLSAEMTQKERMSMMAYEAGDQEKYKALNKEATDAWGKKFFSMVAHSAAILWPIPFALGWMNTRFESVEFPIAFPFTLMFDSVGYSFSFIPIYILCRIIFKYMRPWLPYFNGVQKMLAQTP